MTRIAVASFTPVLFAACAKKENPGRDTTAAVAAAPIPTRVLAPVVGKWQFATIPMPGYDENTMKFVLTATADAAGWTLTFPDKQVVPVKVTLVGDSLQLASAEFSGPRPKETKMKTETTFLVQDGKLEGVTNAHYAIPGTDSTARLRVEGIRVP